MDLSDLQKIKKLYDQGENIINYLKNNPFSNQENSLPILLSYDLQAGSYTKMVNENPNIYEDYISSLSKIISALNPGNLLEAGVGEATTLAGMLSFMESSSYQAYGFDLSWSRVKYAQKHCASYNINTPVLFTGDLFNAPILDNSIDIVYTSHAIEPNGGREREALIELYRITKKYLILLEPCYELASQKARQRMQSLGYITNLQEAIKQLGYKVIEFRLFEYESANPLNPTGLTIIEKHSDSSVSFIQPYACPITKKQLTEFKDCFFCEDSLLVYPKIQDISCLLPENAIIATHFADFS